MKRPTKIAALEDALGALGISINAVCRKADVDRTAWHRVKINNRRFRRSTADKLKAAILDLTNGSIDGRVAIDAVTEPAREAA